MNRKPKPSSPFINSVRQAIRVRHYAHSTEKTNIYWIKKFILFHNLQNPSEIHTSQIAPFLTYLADERKVSPSTQNQAFSALLFLYQHVLNLPLNEHIRAVRAKPKKSIPTVLTRDEVKCLLNELTGTPQLVASLLYGSGLRLMEALRIRVKDLDFEHRCIVVRNGKGAKDRVVTLPDSIQAPLLAHLRIREAIWEKDKMAQVHSVYLPYSLAQKFRSASMSWQWQFVFAASRIS